MQCLRRVTAEGLGASCGALAGVVMWKVAGRATLRGRNTHANALLHGPGAVALLPHARRTVTSVARPAHKAGVTARLRASRVPNSAWVSTSRASRRERSTAAAGTLGSRGGGASGAGSRHHGARGRSSACCTNGRVGAPSVGPATTRGVCTTAAAAESRTSGASTGASSGRVVRIGDVTAQVRADSQLDKVPLLYEAEQHPLLVTASQEDLAVLRWMVQKAALKQVRGTCVLHAACCVCALCATRG